VGRPVYVRLRGQSRRSADTHHRSGGDYCTTEYGQLRTYTGDQRTATVQHTRTFPDYWGYLILPTKRKCNIKENDGPTGPPMNVSLNKALSITIVIAIPITCLAGIYDTVSAIIFSRATFFLHHFKNNVHAGLSSMRHKSLAKFIPKSI
jgi:hypothetical protein